MIFLFPTFQESACLPTRPLSPSPVLVNYIVRQALPRKVSVCNATFLCPSTTQSQIIAITNTSLLQWRGTSGGKLCSVLPFSPRQARLSLLTGPTSIDCAKPRSAMHLPFRPQPPTAMVPTTGLTLPNPRRDVCPWYATHSQDQLFVLASRL